LLQLLVLASAAVWTLLGLYGSYRAAVLLQAVAAAVLLLLVLAPTAVLLLLAVESTAVLLLLVLEATAFPETASQNEELYWNRFSCHHFYVQ
jgi:hypothetical protein